MHFTYTFFIFSSADAQPRHLLSLLSSSSLPFQLINFLFSASLPCQQHPSLPIFSSHALPSPSLHFVCYSSHPRQVPIFRFSLSHFQASLKKALSLYRRCSSHGNKRPVFIRQTSSFCPLLFQPVSSFIPASVS